MRVSSAAAVSRVFFLAMSVSVASVASSGGRSSIPTAFVRAATAPAVSPPEASRTRVARCRRFVCSPRKQRLAMAFSPDLERAAETDASLSLVPGSSPSTRKSLLVSGGATPAVAGGPSGFGFGSAWGVASVVYILMKAITRLAPIAVQPFSRGDFTHMHWAMYGGFSLLMAYAEGFKGFQKKFSPLVVKRALTLDARETTPATPSGRPGPLRLLLAGPYSMGLFHATKKRKTVSWGLTTGVLCLVQLVKRMPYPWRSIIDAGVVVGLSYGTLSICAIWVKALMGTPPSIDPAMPEAKSAAA